MLELPLDVMAVEVVLPSSMWRRSSGLQAPALGPLRRCEALLEALHDLPAPLRLPGIALPQVDLLPHAQVSSRGPYAGFEGRDSGRISCPLQ